MDIITKKKEAYFFLLLASCLSFCIWRYEIEYHGWSGLIWLTYFRKAIPVCLLLFVTWFVRYVQVEPRRLKALYTLLLVLIGSIVVYTFIALLYFLFRRDGYNLMTAYSTSAWRTTVVSFFTYVLLPFFPLLLFLTLRQFRFNIPFRYILLSQGLFLAAPFLGIALIHLVPWKALPDFIHVFKTGYIFPFWFFAIGFPLIHCQQATKVKKTMEVAILDAP